MRLFIGLSPDEAVREELARFIRTIRPFLPGRYVPPERYHLTLAFLGEREESALLTLRSILTETAINTAPFSLSLAGSGYFGPAGNAILYASLVPSEALLTLAALLRTVLAETAESFDPKPFVPHITLAQKAVIPAEVLTEIPAAITFSVSQITLFHSVRINGELRYLPIETVPFCLLSGKDTP